MSSGDFVRTRYQASYGAGTAIHPIRVQPETITADLGADTNSPPAGAINNPISARISMSAKGIGLRPRYVTLECTDATGLTGGYRVGSITRIPVLTPGVFATLQKGGAVQYLDAEWEVVSTTGERVA